MLATPALAADLGPAPVEPMAPMPVYSWTGFYVGAHAGYGWGDSDFDLVFPTNTTLNTSVGFDPDGFVGGLQLGYNYQWDNSFLLGVEADISFSNMHDGDDFVLNTVPNFVRHGSIDIDSMGTLRARAGVTFDNVLVYATGGLLWINQDASVEFPTNPASGSSSDLSMGWVVGAGLEYALDSNWSIKAEYLYGEVGSDSFALTGTIIANKVTYDTYVSIVRLGINYRF